MSLVKILVQIDKESVMKKTLTSALLALLLVGCAGIQRDCSGCMASSLGSSWLIVQYGFNGQPYNCWRLENTAVDNEYNTDGIFWYEKSGHLVHISGWYNRVQVNNSDWKGAADSIGVELNKCQDGRYDDKR
jgi:hypothetical protein